MSEAPAVQYVAAYITIKGAAAAIDFYVENFGAVEAFRLTDPSDGRIGHAELMFGRTRMMISDEFADFGALGPDHFAGSPVKLYIEVPDVNAVFAKAIANGATEMRPVKQQFFGMKGGMLADPFGYQWFIQTKTEDVSPEEMQRRWNEMLTG